jgi:inosine-uridine nucleoside N-ribohydrolase
LAKEELLPLNATVLTLAMLSPMTAIALAFAFSPDIPANSDEIILLAPWMNFR